MTDTTTTTETCANDADASSELAAFQQGMTNMKRRTEQDHGTATVLGIRPSGRHVRVEFDPPYADETKTETFNVPSPLKGWSRESRFVRWIEANGYTAETITEMADDQPEVPVELTPRKAKLVVPDESGQSQPDDPDGPLLQRAAQRFRDERECQQRVVYNLLGWGSMILGIPIWLAAGAPTAALAVGVWLFAVVMLDVGLYANDGSFDWYTGI